MTPRCLLLPLAVALLALPALADTLVLTSGREVNCRIKSESYEKIEFQTPGVRSTQSEDTADVASVTYGSKSPEYRKGDELAQAGQMGEAAGFYLTASDDEDAEDHQRATALMNACDALLSNNNFAEANEFLGELLRKYPTTRHLAPALLGRGTALIKTGKFSEADEVFQELKADAAEKGLGERWGHEANFYLLWSAEAQQKSGVVDGYKQLRSMTKSDYPGISNKCALRLGRVHLDENRVAEAETMFQEIIGSRLETNGAIVAGAYNGRGRCQFGRAIGSLSAGDSERSIEFFQDALKDFLRVHVSYPGIRAEQAEALYFGGQSFINLADLNAEIEDARNNGRVLLKRCQVGFGGTEWAAKAGKEL
ncbi:MAG: tetratricopeptide (TPR) repeat protein [Pseudohongiellaceae bacterium]